MLHTGALVRVCSRISGRILANKVAIERYQSVDGSRGVEVVQNLPWLDSRASGTIDFEVVTKRITQDKKGNFSRFEEKFGKRQLVYKKNPQDVE